MARVIYCISGLGAGEKIFANLQVEGYELKHIPWLQPHKNETIEAYAARMGASIQEENAILIGVSFGGMVSIEIARQRKLQKLILVSSVKSVAELPRWMRVVGILRLHRLLPVHSYKMAGSIGNRRLGVSNEEEKKLVKEYRREADPVYAKWAIHQVLNWKNKGITDTIYHIHGDKDKIFPVKKIKHAFIIKEASHLLVYNRAKEVSEYIMKVLKPALLIGIFLLLSVSIFSQSVIKGRVTDASSGSAIPGSSVFLNNTSIGTSADGSGWFQLSNISSGRYDLVVSAVGYETKTYSFTSEQLPLELKMEMTPKVKELENVIVEPSEEGTWEQWGKTFTDNLIGNTPNALHCKIKNIKSIKFRYYRKSRRVVAYSDEPLVIENKALGYKITYQLEDFEVNFQYGFSTYAGYPLFESMEGRREQKWEKARDKAYYGSLMHFLRCLYNDSLVQNWYDVRRVIRHPNLEKERIKKDFLKLRDNFPDSIPYYDKTMRQRDYFDEYGATPLNRDSLLVKTEGNYKTFFFPDYLLVMYKGELEAQEYLAFHHEARKPTFQQSYIWLTNKQPFTVDVNGNYDPPRELFTESYWSWAERLSNMLPSDYQPYGKLVLSK